MSIATTLNPMGTLGKKPNYIKDGLILWFDALLEPPGTKDYLINWASGTKCQFNNPLTAENGIIANNGVDYARFNPSPMQPIDGNTAYGENYSADLCAVANSAIHDLAIIGMPWRDNLAGSYHVPCWQFYSNARGNKTWVRINSSLTNTGNPYMYSFDDYNPKSLHLEFAKLFVDGVEIPPAYSDGAAGSSTFYMASGTLFYSYRLYNRKLTVEEQRHNYAIDKKRFGVA